MPPYACLINNQSCDYPNKNLSGAGMVYKFCSYIDKIAKTNYAESLLDLVAVGCVADMMDLRNFELKELIDIGTHNIQNPFLVAMVEKQSYSLKGELTPFGISFYIAPQINATIRVGTQEDKLLLFESMLTFKAEELIPSTKRGCQGQFETRVEQACRNCSNLKSKQSKTKDLSVEMIEQIITEEKLADHPIIIICLKEPVEENLTGYIANQIMAKYQRPVLLLNQTFSKDSDEIIWRGSARGPGFTRLTNLREFILKSNLLEFAQGHQLAFGLAIKDKNLNSFREWADKELEGFNFSSSYKVDFIWNGTSIDTYIKTILDLAYLNNIWGQGLPKPYIAIENIKVTKDNLILMSAEKNPTLKINEGDLSLIKFKSSYDEYESLVSDFGYTIINIVGTCELNTWNGTISPQIFIEDYEIVKKAEYYF